LPLVEPVDPTNPPKPNDKDKPPADEETDSGKAKDREPKSKDKQPRNDSGPGNGSQPGTGTQPGNDSQPGKGTEPGNTQPGGGSAPDDREDSGGRDPKPQPEAGESAAKPQDDRPPGTGASAPVGGTQTGPAPCAGPATTAGYPIAPPVGSTTGLGAQGVPATWPADARLAATTAPPRSSEIPGPVGRRGWSLAEPMSLLPDAGSARPGLADPAPPVDPAGARFAAGRPNDGAGADRRRARPHRAEPKKRDRRPHGPFAPASDHTPTQASAAGGSSSSGLARSVIWAVLVAGSVACAAGQLRRHRTPPVRLVTIDFLPVLERPG
jgi:hypothetical protein